MARERLRKARRDELNRSTGCSRSCGREHRRDKGPPLIGTTPLSLSQETGYPDRPPVTPGTPTIPDYLAGTMGALGALVALQHRQRTGEGQVIDVALYEPMLRMLDALIPVFGATGHVRERIGSATEYLVRLTTTTGCATGAGSPSPAPTTGCSSGW